MSDFIVEWTEAKLPIDVTELEFWTIYFDGSLQLQGAGAGVVVVSPKGENFKYVLQLHFPASNNVAEYEARIHGLRIATSLGIKRIKILGDSLLIINQANEEWSCLYVNMMAYCQEIRELENNFDGIKYGHVLRSQSEMTDELAKLGSSWGALPPDIFLHQLN